MRTTISEAIERIRTHPGVTIRTHYVTDAHQESVKALFIRRGKNAPMSAEKLKLMRELDGKNMQRREIARILGCSDTTIWHHLGARYLQKPRKRKKKRK